MPPTVAGPIMTFPFFRAITASFRACVDSHTRDRAQDANAVARYVSLRNSLGDDDDDVDGGLLQGFYGRLVRGAEGRVVDEHVRIRVALGRFRDG
jgi:hypothetical protein